MVVVGVGVGAGVAPIGSLVLVSLVLVRAPLGAPDTLLCEGGAEEQSQKTFTFL